MEKPLKVRLHILSPVHIGCDDVYEPTSFIIDEKKEKLVDFDAMELIKSLGSKEREEFSKVCSGDNLLAIMKTIKRLFKPTITGHEVDIASGLIEHYRKIITMSTFDKKAVINQFTMNRTAYNPHNNLPYIPGSSLKGSLRTAYLSSLAKSKPLTDYWKSCGLLSRQDLEKPEFTYKQIGKKRVAKQLERTLLNGDFETDPFRMIKVSDLLPVEQVKTKVVYATNKSKKDGDRSTQAGKGDVYQIFETIQAGSIFEGSINVEKPQQNAKIDNPAIKDNLLLATDEFYREVLKQEISSIKSLGIKHFANQLALNKFKGRFKKTVYWLRIGRHSGAEAVTIEQNRLIKIKMKDNQHTYLDHATTFWLASEESKPQNHNGLQPFGWAVLEVLQ